MKDDTTPIRLTSLAHGGGCGCKISPALLRDMLQGAPATSAFADLLVGTESSDDAAVYRLNDQQAIVATTDFFMPIVDDGFEFGRIAATNALSDIYAMGGTPIMALAIVGMPIDRLPVETMRQILAGGQAVCRAAGIPIAGGHSIDSAEPIYGLVGIGIVNPARIKRNDRARPGDVLILGKPLGVGILSAALKKDRLSPEGYARMVDVTTRLNTPGRALGELDAVHAMTDVTGFGLLGHLLEICRGSGCGADVDWGSLPWLPDVLDLVQAGIATGASGRNWDSYGREVDLPAAMPDWQRKLLCDPQTSGGLLVAVAPEAVQQVLETFRREGFEAATVIGRTTTGDPRVRVGT